MASRKLSPYRAKRNFKKTSEPSGDKAVASTGHRYLIQKHAARRLHYDFRLELGGTLKSWAVTRGPSLNPEDKRLAVHVEDHPLDYGDFEGTIPHGEYGGGTVMLWDQGEWEPIGDAARGLKKGKLDFELHGKRLKGRWHLVRMHGNRKGDSKRENWLLIKGKDKYANIHGDAALDEYQDSVLSKRSMEKIAGKHAVQVKPVKKMTTAKIKVKRKTASETPPDFVAPQLATLVTTPPRGKGWVHEIKFDGYRLLAHIENGKVTLITRANNDWTVKFKELAAQLATLKADNALMDGEVVHYATDGSMSFHALQNALSTGNKQNLHYYAFDLLFLNGLDLRSKPLLERKKALHGLLKNAHVHLHFSEHFSETGSEVLNHACSIALEGIISKRADAPYHSGRNEDWLKSKCIKEQELVIGGFTMQPKHPGFLGALLMGYYEKDEFIFAGKVGTGFSNSEGRDILKKLKSIAQTTSPFKTVPAASQRGAIFVAPKLVAHVNFAEWTADRMMRHPSFQGLREDKPAKEVVRERPKKIVLVQTPVKSTQKERLGEVTLTHPDKRLYPESNITKRDLAEYYQKIAPLILPHVAGRPISLVRCPNGEGKPCFFQRHSGEGVSPFVKQVKVAGTNEPYLMIEDVDGLTALVQMGVLEIHIWGSTAASPDQPDRLVFDFDPAPDVEFAAVKEAAQLFRKRLKAVELESFLKTTGGKGLHVVVPFKSGPNWGQTKGFARAFSEAIAKEAPGSFTLNNRKDARKGRIFIDYLRNGEGASAIAPYSTRARKNAPVALPLSWADLAKLKSGDAFHMDDAIQRGKQDPWKNIQRISSQKLPLD